MYTFNQLHIRTGLSKRTVKNRLLDLGIEPDSKGLYYPEYVQLIKAYKVKKQSIKFITLPSSINN